LRNDLGKDNYLSYIIAISALAILHKEANDKSSIMNSDEALLDDETTATFLKKVAKDYSKQIEELSNKYDYDTLKATVLLAEPALFTGSGEFSTPEGISRLAIALLDLKPDDCILDLGSGVNSFLIQSALTSKSQNLFGVEINTNTLIVANIRRFILGLPIKVIQGNILSQDFSTLSANKVFSDYPLGMKFPYIQNYVNKNQLLKKYFQKAKRTVSGDWVFTLSAYLNTKQPGKTVVLMTNAGTWNKPDEDYRKSLVSEGAIEGLILLPERLFSNTALSLTMMILSQNNKTVRMVDASKIYTQGRRQNSLESQDVEKILEAYYNDSDISKKLTINELSKQEYILNPKRYIGSDIDIQDGIPLGEICESVNRGAMIKSSDLDQLATTDETFYRYLMLQNIQDGIVDKELPYLKSIEEKYKRHCINDRDLIISKISPFKVAMAHVNKDELILANGNLYFIKLDETKVNPIFVMMFLQSEMGMAQLNRLAKGAVMKSISIQDLKMIQVPNLPREQQDQLAEEYENLSDELIVLNKQIDMILDKKAKLLEGAI
jgi:type I restriction enzyme M protein